MIICSICTTANHHLAVNCTKCGGYIQTRVDTLDLFTTAGRVVERPSKAFHAIAISRHKNYAFLLAAVAGIGIAFTIFWAISASRFADSIANILVAGFVAGPLFGIVLLLILSMVIAGVGRLFGVHAGIRSTFAVIAYAFLPAVMITLFILPVEMVTFGGFFFSDNPSPYALKPVVYVTLLILHGLFVLWNVILLVVGFRMLFDTSWIKTIAIGTIAIGILGGCLYEIFHMLLLPR